MAKNGPGLPSGDDLVTLNRAATVARLVSGVFHDLNNHLLVIGGTAELLTDTPGLPDTAVKGLARIHSANTRATGAIAEAMRFVRQKSEGVGGGAVNLRDLVNHALALRAYAMSKGRLTTTFDVPKEGRAVVQGSAVLLEQAILNLLINAEQALTNQNAGTIRLQLELSPGAAMLRVADNGPGIDPAIASRLFEPFMTTRSREESSGLGLAVARQIAEQHGGTLTLEDTATGASFALRLPAIS